MLLISLFLPWFGVSAFGTQRLVFTGLSDGLLWAVFILALVSLGILVLRAGFGQIPFAKPPGDRQLLAGLSCLNLLLILVELVLVRPTLSGPRAYQIPPGVVTSGLMAGAFTGLAAAAVAMLAASFAMVTARVSR